MMMFFVQPDSNQPSQYRWVTQSGTDKPSDIAAGDLASLLQASKGRPIVLIAPADTVLLTHVDLAIRQAAKLRKAVPFVLEERIAGDLDDMHFALGSTVGERTTVAAIDSEKFATWLLPFEEAGHMPRQVVPEVLLLPRHDNEWSVLVSDGVARVRTGQYEGFSCDVANVSMLLAAELEQREEAPTIVRYWNCDGDESLEWPTVGQEIKTYGCNGDLRVLAQGYQARQALDLLQGTYSQQADWVKILKPWRWAAVLLGVWLTASLGVKYYEQISLEKLNAQLTAQSEKIYRQTFPKARRVVNPRLQMDQQLRALKGAGSATSEAAFVELLAQSAPILRKSSGVKLESIGFRNGELSIKASAPSLSELDRLKQQLAEVDRLQAELSSADSRNGRASGQIKIRQKL